MSFNVFTSELQHQHFITSIPESMEPIRTAYDTTHPSISHNQHFKPNMHAHIANVSVHLPTPLLPPSTTTTTAAQMTIFRIKPIQDPPKDPPQPSPILFPTLPYEIRSQIYRLATFLGAPIWLYTTISDTSTSPPLPSFLPRLAHVNEATRIDIGLWFISMTEFGLLWPQHVDYLCRFLDTFPRGEGWSAVRRLDFQSFGRRVPDVGGDNAFVELVGRCEGVTEVTVKFEAWSLMKRRVSALRCRIDEMQEEDHEEILDVEGIVEKYRLKDLLEAKSLVTLTIEFWPKLTLQTRTGLYTPPPDGWSVIERLAQWFKEGFLERERKVDVRLVASANGGLRWGRKERRGVNSRHSVSFNA